MTRESEKYPIRITPAAARIGMHCYRALLREVKTTPKPGLVDRRNNGAHRDMDYTLFLKSADALDSYFAAVAAYGAATCELEPREAFILMRPYGLQAEADMLLATNGVNTHKGAIFSLGLLAGAAGRHGALSLPLTAGAITHTAALFVAGITELELVRHTPNTKGGRAYAAYGAPGARGEAEAGFPGAMRALAAYRQALLGGAIPNDAAAHALLVTLAHTADTNILTRLNHAAADYAQARAAAMLEQNLPIGSDLWREQLIALDDDFIERNISPGGCADILAAAILLELMETNSSH